MYQNPLSSVLSGFSINRKMPIAPEFLMNSTGARHRYRAFSSFLQKAMLVHLGGYLPG